MNKYIKTSLENTDVLSAVQKIQYPDKQFIALFYDFVKIKIQK